MKRKRELESEELSEKYGCSGFCYGGYGCVNGKTIKYEGCHNIDFCPQTRRKELTATIFAVLTVIFGIPLFLLYLLFMFS